MLVVVFLIIILMTFCISNHDKSILFFFFLKQMDCVYKQDVWGRADDYCSSINENEQITKTENGPIYSTFKKAN